MEPFYSLDDVEIVGGRQLIAHGIHDLFADESAQNYTDETLQMAMIAIEYFRHHHRDTLHTLFEIALEGGVEITELERVLSLFLLERLEDDRFTPQNIKDLAFFYVDQPLLYDYFEDFITRVMEKKNQV